MNTTIPLRQAMRCGLLPRAETVGGMPTRGFPIPDGETTETCPGYTTALAEVREVAMAFPQYKAGYLAEFLTEPPSPETLYACATLDRAHNALEAHRIRERSEEAKRGG